MRFSPYTRMFEGCTSLEISESPTSTANIEWKIPENGIAIDETEDNHTDMFCDCLGTRSTDSPNFNGIQKTYYVQNPPV